MLRHYISTFLSFKGYKTSLPIFSCFMESNKAVRLIPSLPPLFTGILDLVVVIDDPNPFSDSISELITDYK